MTGKTNVRNYLRAAGAVAAPLRAGRKAALQTDE
jgi:hypothetical protein